MKQALCFIRLFFVLQKFLSQSKTPGLAYEPGVLYIIFSAMDLHFFTSRRTSGYAEVYALCF